METPPTVLPTNSSVANTDDSNSQWSTILAIAAVVVIGVVVAVAIYFLKLRNSGEIPPDFVPETKYDPTDEVPETPYYANARPSMSSAGAREDGENPYNTGHDSHYDRLQCDSVYDDPNEHHSDEEEYEMPQCPQPTGQGVVNNGNSIELKTIY